MSVCTEIAIAIAAAPQRASSSTNTRPGREIAVAAAEARGIVQAEEAELAAPPEQRVGEVSGSLPFVHVGTHLGVDEPPHRRSQLVVLGAEDRVRAAHRPPERLPHVPVSVATRAGPVRRVD